MSRIKKDQRRQRRKELRALARNPPQRHNTDDLPSLETFLTLPPELRQEIYDLVLSPSNRLVKLSTHRDFDKQHFNILRDLTTFSFVHKQVREETQQLFFSRATFVVDVRGGRIFPLRPEIDIMRCRKIMFRRSRKSLFSPLPSKDQEVMVVLMQVDPWFKLQWDNEWAGRRDYRSPGMMRMFEAKLKAILQSKAYGVLDRDDLAALALTLE